MRLAFLFALVAVHASATGARRISSFEPSSARRSALLKSKVQQGLHGAKGLLREAKVIVSSDFESAFLKATRPDDNPAKTKHVNALLSLVDEFPMFATPTFDPWQPFFHKMWSRLVEPDPRTALKAAYLLHRLSMREAIGRDAALRTVRGLEREVSKKSRTLYFDATRLTLAKHREAVSAGPLLKFLHAYFVFAFLRFRHFDASLSEMIPSVAMLKRAKRCLSEALKCRIGKDDAHDCALTASCLELLHDDVRTMWPAFVSNVALLLTEHAGEGASPVDAEAIQLAEYCLGALTDVKAFTSSAGSALRRHGIQHSRARQISAPISEDELRELIDAARERRKQM